MTFTVRQAQIIGLFFETFLYGIHFIIFGVCLRCLLWDHNGLVLGQVKRGFLAISVALFIISTLDIALAVVNDYDGLMSPGSQDTLNTPVWLTISRMVLVGIQNLIGGSIWIYRCWIIYNRRWSIVAVPCILFAAGVGLSFAVSGRQPETVGPLAQAKTPTMMIASIYLISFVASLLTTVLIVHRLWTVERDLNRQSQELSSVDTPQSLRDSQPQARSPLGKIMIIIIESGIMFTTTECFCMITFALKSNLSYVASYMDIQIIAIAYNLIAIRSHMARDDYFEEQVTQSWAVALPSQGSWNLNLEGSQGPSIMRSRSRGSSVLPLRPQSNSDTFSSEHCTDS